MTRKVSLRIITATAIFILHPLCQAAAHNCLDCHYLPPVRTYVHPEMLVDECTTCHGKGTAIDDPHAGLNSGRQLVIDVCLTCHQNFDQTGTHPINVSYQTKRNNPRPPLPLFNDLIGCVTCHNPHSSDYENLLQMEYGALCNACHPGYNQPGMHLGHH
jgi:predicted CXXCH cytochrome family protein